MRTIPRRQMAQLMEAYIDHPEGLPEVDPDGQNKFIEEYFDAGAPEMKLAFFACNLSLRVLTPFMKGKPFSRLSEQERQDLINKLLQSHNPLLRGIVFLLGLPVFMSYYRRPEVAVPLGFDSKALKEEANLRTVNRDRDLPPKQEGPA
jgi:hypothetical protein